MSAQLILKLPERSRLIDGLSRVGIPESFSAMEFHGQRLTGSDLDALVFGRRLHGRTLESGEEHGASFSADGGTVIMFGDWSNSTGSARVDGDRLCFVWSTTSDCTFVLRNPGGTRAQENEFIMFGFGGWPFTFSPVE